MIKATRRKKHLCDPHTQLSLLRRLTFHWISFFVVNAIAISLWTFIIEAPNGYTWSEMIQIIAERYAPAAILSIAMLPMFLNDTLKLSNRFAGPIGRLRRALNALAEGSHTAPLSFRKGDFMQDLAADFNQVLARSNMNLESRSNPAGACPVPQSVTESANEHESQHDASTDALVGSASK